MPSLETYLQANLCINKGLLVSSSLPTDQGILNLTQVLSAACVCIQTQVNCNSCFKLHVHVHVGGNHNVITLPGMTVILVASEKYKGLCWSF